MLDIIRDIYNQIIIDGKFSFNQTTYNELTENPEVRKLLKFVHTKLSSNNKEGAHFGAFCNVIARCMYVCTVIRY